MKRAFFGKQKKFLNNIEPDPELSISGYLS